jgi:hypothetical protein
LKFFQQTLFGSGAADGRNAFQQQVVLKTSDTASPDPCSIA